MDVQKKPEVKPPVQPATPPAQKQTSQQQPPAMVPTVQLSEKQVSEFLAARSQWEEEKTGMRNIIAQLENRVIQAEQKAKQHADIVGALESDPEKFVTEQIMKRNVQLEGVAKRIGNDPMSSVLDELKQLRVKVESMERGVTERVSTVDESTKRFQYAIQLGNILSQDRFDPFRKASKIVAVGSASEPTVEELTDLLFNDVKRLNIQMVPPEMYAENLLKQSEVINKKHEDYLQQLGITIPSTPPPGAAQPASDKTQAQVQPGIPPLTNNDETAMLSIEDLSKMPEEDRIKYVGAYYAKKYNVAKEDIDKDNALEVARKFAENRRATDKVEIAAFGKPPEPVVQPGVLPAAAPNADQLKIEKVPLAL
jgi:hypothetical protein